jgi:MAternally affected uncoordination
MTELCFITYNTFYANISIVKELKAEKKQTQHMCELVKELSALDQSLSRSDHHYRERAALSEKKATIQEQLRNMNGFSSIGREYLESVYFGNGRTTLGDKLQLVPSLIDGEWLPKSDVYAPVDLIVVVFGCPKELFKECGKRLQSGMCIIQGCSA